MIVRQRGSFAFVMDALRGTAVVLYENAGCFLYRRP